VNARSLAQRTNRRRRECVCMERDIFAPTWFGLALAGLIGDALAKGLGLCAPEASSSTFSSRVQLQPLSCLSSRDGDVCLLFFCKGLGPDDKYLRDPRGWITILLSPAARRGWGRTIPGFTTAVNAHRTRCRVDLGELVYNGTLGWLDSAG
jgi:hypothetical protein